MQWCSGAVVVQVQMCSGAEVTGEVQVQRGRGAEGQRGRRAVVQWCRGAKRGAVVQWCSGAKRGAGAVVQWCSFGAGVVQWWCNGSAVVLVQSWSRAGAVVQW